MKNKKLYIGIGIFVILTISIILWGVFTKGIFFGTISSKNVGKEKCTDTEYEYNDNCYPKLGDGKFHPNDSGVRVVKKCVNDTQCLSGKCIAEICCNQDKNKCEECEDTGKTCKKCQNTYYLENRTCNPWTNCDSKKIKTTGTITQDQVCCDQKPTHSSYNSNTPGDSNCAFTCNKDYYLETGKCLSKPDIGSTCNTNIPCKNNISCIAEICCNKDKCNTCDQYGKCTRCNRNLYINNEGDCNYMKICNRTTPYSLEPTDGTSKKDQICVYAPMTNKSLKQYIWEYIQDTKRDFSSAGKIEDWNTSQVTDMSGLFKSGTKYFGKEINKPTQFISFNAFDVDISKWDTSNVTDMSQMFMESPQFNRAISTKQITRADGSTYTAWNTSNVTNMAEMFFNAFKFNQDISMWNTSNVTDMKYMFTNAMVFNQDISTKQITRADGSTYTAWNTSNVTNMEFMFFGAKVFNQDISTWNISNVTNMTKMFQGNAYEFNNKNEPLTWDIAIMGLDTGKSQTNNQYRKIN